MKHAELWKRILHSGIGCVANDRMRAAVISAPQIVDARGGNRDVLVALDRKGLAIPFPRFWLEGNLFDDGTRWGAYVMTKKQDDHTDVECACVLCRPTDSRPIFIGGYRFALDAGGNVTKGSRQLILDKERVEIDGRDAAEEVTGGIGAFVMDTLQILGCRNVSLSPRNNDPKDTRIAAKRHGGNPDYYKYHVLVVRPPGARSDAPSQEIGTMPRHVCRGHFAEYGPEFNKGLLFGKYAGRFFIPPHLKGDKGNGTVEKDYEIRPPNGPRPQSVGA